MNNKNSKPADNKNIKDGNRLTRSRTQENPELKSIVEDRNHASAFLQSRKTPRSPTERGTFDFTPKVTTEVSNANTELGAIPRTKNVKNLTINTNQTDNAGASGQDKNIGLTINPSNSANNNKQTETVASPLIRISPQDNRKNTEILNETVNNSYKNDLSLLEIEGITEQPSLIGNPDEGNIKGDISLIWGSPKKMTEQQIQTPTVRLPLKYVAKLVPEFDGKDMPVAEYIENLKYARNSITPADESSLIPIVKVKLKGQVHKALINSHITSINDFIKAIRILFPSTENIHTLYGKLTELTQEPDETVLNYVNRLQDLVIEIKELNKTEADITEQEIQDFDKKINIDAKKSFKEGLKPEIRLEMKDKDELDALIQAAIKVETKLEKRKILRSKPASILFNLGKPNASSTIYTCQICQDPNHEALFCNNAACVYCKSKDHISYRCKLAKRKIELICTHCNAPGHSIDACKMNKLQGRHCQYCQYHTAENCPTPMCPLCKKLGHTIKQCPLMKDNGLQLIMCTNCNEEGHDAEECEGARVFQTRTNQIKYQNCNQVGHSSRDYHEPRNPQRRSNDSYGNNQNFNHNNNNFQRKYNSNGNFNNNNYSRSNNSNRDNPRQMNESRKFCDYCRTPNHTIKECRKLKSIQLRVQKRDICSYCEEPGHQIDACRKLKSLESSAGNICNLCKSTNHTTEECYRNQNHQQHRAGNE
ncbi:putative uncharacterized protein DDB_G0291812 [Osmia bicornis bicornis]|uniref:putative uncharacterized protein DDB_G0291812 n=1 Tax=Osmia bicornis bicornis TaxID=1437191 RepID=UPI001EAF7338|nr:putative uncharacterized protein DDB_G0291812 [Osmia bicornis bicornis]